MANRKKESADQAHLPCNAGNNDREKDGELKDGFITFLSKQHELVMLTEEALADELGVTPRTIRRMIERRELPKPLLLGGKKIWKIGAIVEHFDNMSRLTLQEAQIEAKKFLNLG